MLLIAVSGVENGEIRPPLKSASQRRPILPSEEPAMFWFSLGMYSVLGVGVLTLPVWSTRAALDE